MLNKIAEITGLRFSTSDLVAMSILERIAAKLPEGTTSETKNFEKLVQKAEASVDAEGQMAIVTLVKMITADPIEKVLKIKSSPKGVRIKIAATNGVRYSFGPIWNASIQKGKGIAFAEVNREKLNHQAIMLGIKNPASLKIETLATKIAAKL